LLILGDTLSSSWLRQLVKEGPDNQAGQAAYQLSRFGSPGDRSQQLLRDGESTLEDVE
jgi:hypothetical protein